MGKSSAVAAVDFVGFQKRRVTPFRDVTRLVVQDQVE